MDEAANPDTPLLKTAAVEEGATAVDTSDIDDSDENQFLQPSGRRWDPLGEAAPEDDDSIQAQFDADS